MQPSDSLGRLLQLLQQERAVLVTVLAVRGSVPRDAGTWMAVFATDFLATIGGGKLELDAMHHAREILRGLAQSGEKVLPLGPSLGQCCGGEVRLAFEAIGAADAGALRERLAEVRTPVAVFGGGHVGQALVQALAPLPFAIRWVDSRDEVFPMGLPDHVECEYSNPVQAAVADLQPGSRVLIMSFSHAEDLDIVAACLARQRDKGDLPFVGMIGSKTKWATFRKRLLARAFTDVELDQVVCPIGVQGISDKRPAVIAVAVAAQLLQLGLPVH
jgi:xanthine dehydrogenase accessory factor